jgi:hypothetical protein
MIKLLLLTFAVSPLTLLAVAAPALATDQPSGRDFGCHVRTHAQTTGFGDGMSPGQHHQGFSGWTGEMPC